MSEELRLLWKAYTRHKYPDDGDRQFMLQGLMHEFLEDYKDELAEIEQAFAPSKGKRVAPMDQLEK